jgi:hypothetical protein
LWVLCLLSALTIAGIIGAERFPVILDSIKGRPDWGVVTAHIILASLGLGAPAWFAIVATKQISQRFKLAEDYGYKAAISAAYEGYRAEAMRQGDEFEKRLFGSTLDRLDEQPLRFVDSDNMASPMHEIGKVAKKVAENVEQSTLKVAEKAGDLVSSAIARTGNSDRKDDNGKDD